MNFLKAYILGLRTAITYPRVLLTTYLVNLLLVSVFSFALLAIFKSMGVHSEAFSGFMQAFDYSTFSDLKANYGDKFASIIPLAIGLAIVYWFISLFLTGGILASLKLEKFTMKSFFGGAAYNFFSFLMIDIIGWAIFLSIAAGLTMLTSTIVDYFNPSTFAEKMQFGIIASIIFGINILLAVMTITYAKAMLILNNSVNFIFYIFKALGFSMARFYFTFPLIILLVLPPLGVAYGYLQLDGLLPTNNIYAIFVVFAAQQAFILLRIFFRIWLLSSHLEFYDRQYFQKKTIAVKTQEDNTPAS